MLTSEQLQVIANAELFVEKLTSRKFAMRSHFFFPDHAEIIFVTSAPSAHCFEASVFYTEIYEEVEDYLKRKYAHVLDVNDDPEGDDNHAEWWFGGGRSISLSVSTDRGYRHLAYGANTPVHSVTLKLRQDRVDRGPTPEQIAQIMIDLNEIKNRKSGRLRSFELVYDLEHCSVEVHQTRNKTEFLVEFKDEEGGYEYSRERFLARFSA